MFSSYEFNFAGKSSLAFGLKLYDFDGKGQDEVSFGNKASISETRLNNKIQPLHFGVNYHEKPLEFKLIFGAEKPLDRYDLEEIAMWLTGYQDYQWLTIDQSDMERVQFKCLIEELTPLSHGWLPVAFEASVRCDCSYAYGHPFKRTYKINGTTKIRFFNESSVRDYWKPELTICPASGVTDFKIVNKSDNDREFAFTGMPAAGLNIEVDNVNGIIRETVNNYNMYQYFNLNFLRFLPGENILEVTGDGTITLSGQFLYNVAG